MRRGAASSPLQTLGQGNPFLFSSFSCFWIAPSRRGPGPQPQGPRAAVIHLLRGWQWYINQENPSKISGVLPTLTRCRPRWEQGSKLCCGSGLTSSAHASVSLAVNLLITHFASLCGVFEVSVLSAKVVVIPRYCGSGKDYHYFWQAAVIYLCLPDPYGSFILEWVKVISARDSWAYLLLSLVINWPQTVLPELCEQRKILWFVI